LPACVVCHKYVRLADSALPETLRFVKGRWYCSDHAPHEV
jgi:hypothetical protein